MKLSANLVPLHLEDLSVFTTLLLAPEFEDITRLFDVKLL